MKFVTLITKKKQKHVYGKVSYFTIINKMVNIFFTIQYTNIPIKEIYSVQIIYLL